MKSLALVAALLLASCGGQSTLKTAANASPATATTSHTTPSAATTVQATSAPQVAGVLIDLGSGDAATYDLTLVRADGTVAATVHPKKRALIMASGISAPAAIELPYVSSSQQRAYYLDGDAAVKFLALDGSSGSVATVPGSARAHAAFAVTPDDKRIAVSVLDYATTPPTVRLYVEDLSGANHHEIFSSNSLYVWPVGWHAGQLVLAVGPIYSQQGVAWNPYDAAAYHVVDPTTANRTATIGSGESATGCQPTGLLSTAGTACVPLSACLGCPNQSVEALDWNGQRVSSVTGAMIGSLSPDGLLATCCNGMGYVTIGYSTQSTPLSGDSTDWACWVDASHLLAGFTIPNPQLMPKVIDVTSGVVSSVNAKGFCAATLPVTQ